MDRRAGLGRDDPNRFPRTRGDGPRDGPPSSRSTRVTVAVSPHTRGWTPPAPARRWPGRVSPHTRGWTLSVDGSTGPLDGFPAHAGMDLALRQPRVRPPRFPRTRGDGPWDGPPDGGGSVPPLAVSPHTRGWTRPRRAHLAEEPGFPAHAGMDPESRSDATGGRWFPRTRGDGPGPGPDRERNQAVSPHTRGWTQRRHLPLRRPRGFPAHAGMDRTLAGLRDRALRFPRTRGDGPAGHTRAAALA